MGFDLSNLFSYQSKNDTYSPQSAINGTKVANTLGENGYTLSTKDLAAFPKGSSVTGQVVSVEGENVQLRLADDTYINARVEKDLNVTVGQKMTFEVKSNSGNTLSLTPLFTNLNTSTNVIKGLEAANIPVTDSTVNMVTAMMDKGMSIDVNALQNMYRQVLANPYTEPSALVEMKQLSIPITGENAVQYEAYKNYEHQIISSIEDIVRNLEQTCLDLIQTGDSHSAASIYKEVVAMLTEAEMLTTQSDILDNQIVKGPNSAGNMGNIDNQSDMGILNLLDEDGKSIIEGKGIGSETGIDSKGIIDGEIVTNSKGIIDGEIVTNSKEIAEKNQSIENINIENKNIAVTNELANANMPKNQGELAGLLNDIERATFARNLKALGISEQIAGSIKDGSISYNQLFAVLNKVFHGNADENQLQKLYTSREFQTLVKNQFTNQLLLEPETVGKEGKVLEYYEKLNEQTIRLTDALSALGKENTSLFKSVNTLAKNVDFMNQLNQTFAYVQLPLKFSEENGHGDLYVYTNKKNLAKETGSISALLHLDMEYLGPMDIYVVMTNNQRVNTKFYLQDEEMLAFIESNLHILDERLVKKGYSLNVETTTKKQEVKSFEEKLLGNESEEKHVLLSTQAFDMRA